MERTLLDPELADLASQLGLRHARSPAEWRQNALARLGPGRFEQLQAWRANLAQNPGSEAEFYDFVTADGDIAAAMLEGRLGYYDALLPRIAEHFGTLRPRRVLDAGSYCGVASLYLGRRLPEIQFVGIERCEGAVRLARRALEKVPLGNVEFVHGDYLRRSLEPPCDAAMSLQSLPTYLLPQLPSEGPSSYHRGALLEAAVGGEQFPGRPVAEALAALHRLTAPTGHVLLHERLADIGRALLFGYLAARAGFQASRLQLVSWQAANEREGVQRAPLIVAERRDAPASFDESAMVDCLFERPARVDALSLGLEQPVALTGPQAQWSFDALEGQRVEQSVRGAFRDRHRFLIRLGILAGARAYVYTCATSDYRELKICDVRYALMLFAPVAQQLLSRYVAGEISEVDPDPAALDGLLRAKFGF